MSSFGFFVLKSLGKDIKPMLKRFPKLSRLELATLLLREPKSLDVGLIGDMILINKVEKKGGK